MQIKIISTKKISDHMERWLFSLPRDKFMEFGFFIESMEGIGIHRRSFEAENQMEVDVAIGFRDELLALLSAMQRQE